MNIGAFIIRTDTIDPPPGRGKEIMALCECKNGIGTGGITGEKKGTSWFGADYPNGGSLADI